MWMKAKNKKGLPIFSKTPSWSKQGETDWPVCLSEVNGEDRLDQLHMIPKAKEYMTVR